MPLPFDIGQAETVEFSASGYGTFALPKFGSVTPAEELAIIPVLKAWSETQDGESMLLTWVELATIALQRNHPDQHSSQTQHLPRVLVQELADFLLNERRGWEEVEEDPEKKAPIGSTTKAKRGKPSPPSTGESAPAGPAGSPQSDSPTSRST